MINLCPLTEKFKVFGWDAESINGHDLPSVIEALKRLKEKKSGKPKVLIAETIKGKGVLCLEQNVLCHVMTLTKEQVDKAIQEIQ